MNPRDATHAREPREPSREASVSIGEYRRLVAILTGRAKRLGSRDAEGASQEALKRCLENANSRAAMEFYFNETPAALPPEWPLDRLLAWLHAILHNVVREERNRAGYWREVESTERPNGGEFAASAPDPLEALMQQEVAAALGECIGKLEHDQRTVLRLRARGMKYGEIADRMGVNENTVATWISRGTRMLGKLLRSRLGGGDAG